MAQAGRQVDNPVSGERIVFRVTRADSDGELFAAEHFFPGGSPQQPEHVHPRQESRIEILGGRGQFKLGGRERQVQTGDVLITPPGVAHQIWNPSDNEELHIRFEYRPALESTELFLETLFGIAHDGRTDGHGMPGLLQLALMVRAYDDYIRLASPPWPVQRVLFGALAPLARMRGYRSAYPHHREQHDGGRAESDRRELLLHR